MENTRIDMLGILAPANDPILRGKENVFINSQQDLQYIVKRISYAPQQEDNDSSIPYTGYMDSLSGGYENCDDISQLSDIRKSTFKNDFERRVFVFNSWHDRTRDTWKLIKGRTVIRERTQNNGIWATKYITIPVFQPKEQTALWEKEARVYLERNYSSYDEFCSLLQQKNRIGLVKGFYEPISSPFVIWFDSVSNDCFALGGFEKCVASENGYQFIYDDYLGVIKLDDNLLSGLVYPEEFNPTIMYLEVSCYSELYNRFAKRDVDEFIVKPAPVEETNPAKNISNDESSQNKELHELSAEKTERNLLEYCKYYAHRSNLYYDYYDLANFHTAIKTRSLVILSGMSGTGKSRLVEVYAKALGIKPESTLIIPVRPSWNDDSDLLGYVDLNKMVYRPSETGFIELLREAHENADQMYLVCFDEMNLARVEHYFSQFLSILEKPADAQRKLRIYSDSLKGLYNASEYPSEIPIGDNIIFVGTVNIDESTYHFSDKVLDRSNVLQLKVLDYSKEWKKVNYAAVPPTNAWTKNEFNELIQEPSDNEYSEYRAFLWEMHCRLQAVNETLGIGPRVVKQIEKYLCNFPELEEPSKSTKDRSFDLQLVQRVFTKIRGSEDKLKKIFETTGDDTIFDDLFQRYSALSSFEHSRSVLKRKKEELKVYGYCI